MAEAAVTFLLGNLKDLLSYHISLIKNTKKNIESLQTDLSRLKASLEDSRKKRRNNERMKQVDREIRDAVYEVEDVIDAFVTQALENKASSALRWLRPAVNLHEIAEKIDEVKEKVNSATIYLQNVKVDDDDKSAIPEARPPRLKDVVGFVDVTNELRDRLTAQTNYFDVVCLVGMFGLGKTTLAWKIFNDPVIVYEFPIRIWLSISQVFSDKDIFISILEHFTKVTEDIRKKNTIDLAQLVVACLADRSFLIVMDDVWSPADWDRLNYALPNDNNKGKVLITSRSNDVGTCACRPRTPHNLRHFNQDESWELLRLEALRTLDCPALLDNVGQRIARGCDGLPLALVVIGGILATKYSTDLSATEKQWEEVSAKVVEYFKEDPAHRMDKFISLSYDILPTHLRACFLYLAMFPEDFEIPASKLILMWIGEGFIHQTDGSRLEEIGEKILEELINRNLVIIEKIKRDGKVKTCRIHDALRDFCRKEAENENFLREVKSDTGVFLPPVSELNKFRRLSINSNFLKFLSLKPVGHCVRSFVRFSKDKLNLPLETIPDILKAFKLLRVLDVNCVFPRINNDLYQLVHIRYIALSFNLSTLPAKFNQLWNLQTLLVDTTSKTLEVKADIFKFIQLRHFKTNVSTTLIKPSKDSKHGEELQTLGTISVESCSTELFQQASNLKKLGIRGQLTLLLEGKKGSFDSFKRMKFLETLKLINDVYPLQPSAGQLDGLPQYNQFPPRLKSLTLRATYLDWSNMSILGALPNLEVLKLKDKAFMGNTWVAVNGGFPRLEVLLINDTNLEIWGASSHHFPKLKGLVLRDCDKLLGVPSGLASIETFQLLDLYNCKSVVLSAKKVRDAKMKAEAAFKLSIFPPTD